MNSYDIHHIIYYDATVQLLVCRNTDTREVEFTREGNPIDANTNISAVVRDFFEGYQVVASRVSGHVVNGVLIPGLIYVTTRHTRIDLEI